MERHCVGDRVGILSIICVVFVPGSILIVKGGLDEKLTLYRLVNLSSEIFVVDDIDMRWFSIVGVEECGEAVRTEALSL